MDDADYRDYMDDPHEGNEPNEPNERPEEHEAEHEADDAADDVEAERTRPPSEDRVRLELILFSELIQTLATDDRLLDAVPFLLGRLGDLRRVLFDYEVRCTERLLPIEDPDEREARRLLRKIEERKREMIDEWGDSWTPPEGDDAESGPAEEDNGEAA